MRLHHDEDGRGRTWFKCWERLSNENNDFCGCTHGRPKPLSLTVYAVRNANGEFYRSYAVQKRPGAWVENIADAKVYTKRGPAQGQVTRFQKRGERVELVALTAIVRET